MVHVANGMQNKEREEQTVANVSQVRHLQLEINHSIHIISHFDIQRNALESEGSSVFELTVSWSYENKGELRGPGGYGRTWGARASGTHVQCPV